MRRICFSGLILLLGAGVLAQQVGDQATAGYTSARTNLNSDFGSQVPPYSLSTTIDLTNTVNASSLLAFSSQGTDVFLVGESTASTSDFRLFNASTGALLWTNSFPNATGMPLNYKPAVANDVVILGGPATTTVKGVEVSTGAELWQDTSVGGTSGVYPFITNGLAVYGGEAGFQGVHPTLGPNPAFWSLAVTTAAEAPIASSGQQAYFATVPVTNAGLSNPTRLYAVDRSTGDVLWATDGVVGQNNPSIVATESLVFVNDDNRIVSALNSLDGSVVWQSSAADALALAYDRLYLFAGPLETELAGPAGFAPESTITVLDPNTGELLWEVVESGDGGGLRFPVIANNIIYYYNEATNRVRARDAFTGALLWSQNRAGVRDMAAVNGSIVLLLSDQIEIYRTSNVLYFAQIADGEGQSTLLAISNNSDEPAFGTLNFFDPSGDPLSLGLEGVGDTSSLVFSVPAGASVRIQTLDGDMAQRGWARVISDEPLSGSSIFQARGMDGRIEFEAGVGSSRLSGRGNVFAEFLLDMNSARTINTALAVANPSDETANVSFVLVNSGGDEVESAMRTLQPGEQIAEFISQIFPGRALLDTRGSVRIRSDIPIVITTLRTQGGFQLSSYAVAQ